MANEEVKKERIKNKKSEIAKPIVKKIKVMINDFTPRQKLVAKYFINHWESFGFQSINDLAKSIGVSEATIVRFCNALGYEGYAQLGRKVQEDIQSNLSSIGRFSLAYSSSHSITDKPRSAFERVLMREMNNLTELPKKIQMEDYFRCIQWMEKADQVVIVGCLASASLANYFGFMLSKILPSVKIVDGLRSMVETGLHGFGTKTLVFLISFPRHPRFTLEIGKWIKKKKVKIVALTNSHASPLVNIADISFTIPVGIASFVDTFAGPVTFINALVTELSERIPQLTQPRLEEYEDYADAMEFFMK